MSHSNLVKESKRQAYNVAITILSLAFIYALYQIIDIDVAIITLRERLIPGEPSQPRKAATNQPYTDSSRRANLGSISPAAPPNPSSRPLDSKRIIKRAVAMLEDRFRTPNFDPSASVTQCYHRAEELRTANALQYCYYLDELSASRVILTELRKGSHTPLFFQKDASDARLNKAFTAAGLANQQADLTAQWAEALSKESSSSQ